jgi:predicted glycogen debranching enzyme
MIQFGHETCADLDVALAKEWLETNGIGGFASSTIVGLNTRRYHGLLVAATMPPVGRFVLLSKVEETLFIDERAFELSANRYPGAVYPQGFRYLRQFRLDPFPVFTYEIDGIEIEKSVFMVYGENTTAVQYSFRSSASLASRKNLRFEVRPLIAFRDFHSLTHENYAINSRVAEHEQLASITPYTDLPSFYLAHNGSGLVKSGQWYRNFEYDAERERGLDYREDLFNPLVLDFDVTVEPQATIIASTAPQRLSNFDEYRETEIARRAAITKASPVTDEFTQALTAAADQFVVSRGDQKTVIAGYHWFSDWGRDTMIALPGLALPTGRHDVAKSILRNFAQHVDHGLIPNRFPDRGELPEYNTVDATLWFFEAARAYLAYTNDVEFVHTELYPVFVDIISWHIRGTRFGIGVDSSGLLNSGEPGVQLTWMDAKVGDWVVTPRRGKPVEIQALWYNALCILEDLARRFQDSVGQERYGQMANAARISFNELFWNDAAGCLYDVVDRDVRDPAIRPNQIFAISLPHSMLSSEHARQVVERVQEHLLTPYGLRTLSPSDPQYQGRYAGGPVERDGAYHQGTVWPWLMGPFIRAYIKVHGDSPAARDQTAIWLEPLKNHLTDGGLGQISEIFDGDAPRHPRGCVAQAWSVAEILRTYVEDVKQISPTAQARSATVISQ